MKYPGLYSKILYIWVNLQKLHHFKSLWIKINLEMVYDTSLMDNQGILKWGAHLGTTFLIIDQDALGKDMTVTS